MRALLFTRPAPDSSASVVVDVPPPTATPGRLVIDVEHAGVNFVDVMARRGDPGYVVDWPHPPGLEVVGLVAHVSEGSGFHPGERVAAHTGRGGLAEQVVAEESLTRHVPDQVGGPAAAIAPLTLATALLLVGGAAPRGEDLSLLMHSAGGGVGAAVAQVAPLLGVSRLVGTVGSEKRRRQAHEAGWPEVVLRGDDLDDRLTSAAPGGFDLVLDPVGTLLSSDLRHLAAGGRVVVFGNPAGGALGSSPDLVELIRANASVGGFSASRLAAARPDRVGRALADALEHLAASRVSVAVDVVDGLEQVPAVLDALATGRHAGKSVVRLHPA
ncbi:zinc-binding dehydrogenase [Nocardioides sp.]|uniref:quinone oxidoreductase family protein n=1 Tax=Nocardioides sp. TaxID=35761 RepID=UPI002716CEF3|nr:zinc-binding dehydrogenase [Nocardioides sp.]MDO9456022.1 zinc-binding dehydrogenase [Nocardioides sp.]